MNNDPLSLRRLFFLDSSVTFLNHGSFGATPIPVFEKYQDWQRILEKEPVEFLGRKASEYLAEARKAIAPELGCDPDDFTFVTNATTGMNIVIHSLSLTAEDEVLTTNHEYGAIDKTWQFYARQKGFKIVRARFSLPVNSPDLWIEELWSQVTPRTRVISISHVTSPTALVFPLEKVIERARKAGILTLIDGAHAPGQVPLNLKTLGADFYTGNFHKWVCAPKGAGFLYVRPEYHSLIQPLVVSWGYDNPASQRSIFLDHTEWWGTRDISAFLTVPEAYQFLKAYHWDEVRERCHQQLKETCATFEEKLGVAPLTSDLDTWSAQMVSLRIPHLSPQAIPEVSKRLWEEYRIEVPLVEWEGSVLIRISSQGYNTPDDFKKLEHALDEILVSPGAQGGP